MKHRPQIRFQSWVMVMVMRLVGSLAAAFLFTVFRTFTSISAESARERFSLMR